jgi:DNA-directed RNA polymerase subunit RPC12/RpoP
MKGMNATEQTRRCSDCGETFEVININRHGQPDPREIRCLNCQVQFRLTGKTGIQRMVEAAKAKAESLKDQGWTQGDFAKAIGDMFKEKNQ